MKNITTNNFPNSFGFKRYYTQDYYLKTTFGQKIFKVPLNAGFTCPNRDGTKGYGGCTYCSAMGSGDFAGDSKDEIKEQFVKVKEKLHQKWPKAGYIAYFQAFTNTYGSVEHVRTMLETAEALDGVVGISISTRPDCIDGNMADMLAEFAKKMWFEVELGLQSIHSQTASLINRCHSLEDFEVGYNLLKSRGVPVCIHIINGLPNETQAMMLKTAEYVADLKPDGVKIHMLHLIQGSKMANDWQNQPFELLSLDEYVSIVASQIELLSPNTVVERVTGDGEKDSLLAPLWTLKKLVVINNIDKELIRRESYQGKHYKKANDGGQA